MLRGARFASQHALTPDETTLAAMRRDSGGMTALTKKGVSGTVQDELRKLLMGDDPGKGLRLMRDTGMLQSLLPELAPMVGFDQRSVYHEHTVDEHTFHVIDELARAGASYEARLAALFHDSGKPLTASPKPNDPEHFHFHSHPEHGDHQDVGADIARRTLERLNFPRDDDRPRRRSRVRAHGHGRREADAGQGPAPARTALRPLPQRPARPQGGRHGGPRHEASPKPEGVARSCASCWPTTPTRRARWPTCKSTAAT